MIPSDLMPFWLTLGRPLTRLLFAMCIGLLIANIVEALRWTQPLARLSAPLVRLARLREAAGASFSMAFFSPAAANALLSDSHAKGEISLRELVLANLFNSLPAYMVHLPTMLFMLWPVLGAPALIYTGLTLAAAALRTLFTVGLGHFLLPPLHGENCIECRLPQEKSHPQERRAQGMETVPPPPAQARHVHHPRVRRHVPDAALRSVPHRRGVAFRPYPVARVHPARGARHRAPEPRRRNRRLPVRRGFRPAYGRAHPPEVIIALLVGNILSTPMRTVRHQFPAYAGYYSPGLAFKLIFYNQLLRTITMIGVTWAYWLCAIA